MRLSPKDALFLYTDGPRSRQATIIAAHFFPREPGGTLPTRPQMREWFLSRTSAPAFRRRLVRYPFDIVRPWWTIDSTVDLDQHLTFRDGTHWPDAERILAELAQEPMDLTRPPWDLTIMENVRGVPGTTCAAHIVILRIHHCFGDGLAVQPFLSALFEVPSQSIPFPPQSRTETPDRIGALRTVGAVGGAIREYISFVRRIRKLDRSAMPVAAPSRASTVLDGPIGPRRIVMTQEFELDDLIAIQNAIGGVSKNDLVLTIIGGAMIRYLSLLNSVPTDSLTATMPVTFRPKSADGSLADNSSSANNQFTMVMIDLHTTLADPVARARAISATVSAERNRMGRLATPGHADVSVDYVPPGFAIRAKRRRREDRTGHARDDIHPPVPYNTSLMTIYPITFPAGLLDCTSTGGFGFGPLNGAGTSHTAVSYGGSVHFSVLADADVVTRPNDYTQAIRDSFHDLHAAALGAP